MDKDRVLAELATRGHGHVAARDLRRLGVTRHDVRRRVAAGILVPVHRGVHRHAAVAPSTVGRIHAAVLAAGPGSVASHRSAALLHGLREVPRWRPEVTVVGGGAPSFAGVDVHRSTVLDERDRTTIEGIPTTAPARTLLSLGAVVHPVVVLRATHDALIRQLVDVVALLTLLERVGRRGRDGTAALRAAVADGLPPAGAQSRLEADLLALLRRSGIVPPALQHELRTEIGVVRLDAAWPELRLAVEADGRRWHSTGPDFARDLRRSRAIVAAGYTHLRFGWSDVHDDPACVATTVRPLLASLRARPAA